MKLTFGLLTTRPSMHAKIIGSSQKGRLGVEDIILIFVIAATIFILFASFSRQAEQKEIFMKQCLIEHKQYECDALWGQVQGSSNNNLATGVAIGTVMGMSAGRR